MVRQTLGILLCLLALTVKQSWAEERYALVIGNGKYVNIDALKNPPRDARLISDALKKVGFEVTTLIDVNKRSMDDAARALFDTLRDADRDTVGLFYFAGHGVTYDAQNWLLPVGAPVKQGADIPYQTISANWILASMEEAPNATDIIILDSCRNSPFRGFSLSGTRSVSGGMAEMKGTARGSFIAYSTAPGMVAQDGTGDYSPFAEALSSEINRPDISIGDMMVYVADSVEKATKSLSGSPQIPWRHTSMREHFYFNPTGGKEKAQRH